MGRMTTEPEGFDAPTTVGMTPAGPAPRPRAGGPAVLAWALWALAVLCLGLTGWFDRLLGQDSSLAVAVATPVVAAQVQPARRRVQALVELRAPQEQA